MLTKAKSAPLEFPDEYCCLMITMKYCAMNAHDECCKAQLDHEAEEYYEAQLDHDEVLRGTTGSRRGTVSTTGDEKVLE